MTRARRLAPALLALFAVAAGCAPARSLVASPGDYAAYRATRVAPTFDDRLAAAALYLDRFPQGTYADEVRAYFREAEPVFYAAKRGSALGLEAYLRALPKGSRSADVLAELRALLTVKTEREELRGAASMGVRLSSLAAQRVRVRTEIEAWVRRFLDVNV